MNYISFFLLRLRGVKGFLGGREFLREICGVGDSE